MGRKNDQDEEREARLERLMAEHRSKSEPQRDDSQATKPPTRDAGRPAKASLKSESGLRKRRRRS